MSRLLDENTANIEKAKSRRSACGTDANPRNTPRWATVMRKSTPRSVSPAHGSHTGSSDIKLWEPRIDCDNFEIA